MVVDDLAAESQTETCPIFARRVEGIKDLIAHVLIHAESVVSHPDPDFGSRQILTHGHTHLGRFDMRLLEGIDQLGYLLSFDGQISNYEQQRT